MKIDDVLYNQILQEIEAGYINVQNHSSLPLRIFNYSNKTQYDWHWNEATSICRGLILDDQNNIIARPFEKFFTYEQCKEMNIQIPNKPFKVFEKLDGSLCIMYVYGDYVGIATRGSFGSDQAILANKILENYPNETDWFKEMSKSKGYTFLFEVIGPENRIVVPYEKNDLILLACIDNKTGRDVAIDNFWFNWPTKAKRYKQFESETFEMMKNQNLENEEGYVALFDNGFRMKIKFDNYLELHRLYCGMSNKLIWEMLRDGKDAQVILEKMPDEFYSWAQKVIKDLGYKYTQVKCEALRIYDKASFYYDNRKLYAQEVMKHDKKYQAILFALLDKKKFDHIIWKIIEPETTEKFNSL